jgi:hypothetical protein
MTMLSPAATFHAELRQQLEQVGRAISVQRGLVWLARGLAAGSVVVLGLVIWAWTSDSVKTLPIPILVGVPIVAALLMSLGSLFVRHSSSDLARRIDRAARLHERSATALELGARGDEFPLAIAQMRDAVEHLKRVDMLEAFPLRAPRRELMATFFVVLVAAIVGISPNPWLLRARASNPSITIAREQAQRVQRLADSLPQNQSADVDALRQLISKGAKTMDARSNEPDAALNALQDLEEQVQQMSAGDDQLSAALAAVAGALAGDQATQPLADAINTGDMRQISQASKDLAQAMQSMSPQDQQRVAMVMKDAANRAGRVSQSTSSQLQNAADGLQAAAAAAAASQADPSQADGQQGDGSNGAQAAADAMNQLSDSAAAADARQRAASQLESSRNALERALGRTQSRSGSNSNNGNANSRSAANGQGSSADQSGSQGQDGQGQGQGQGQGNGDQAGGGTDPGGAGSQNGQAGDGNDTGQGGGYSTGGDPNSVNNGGSPSGLDAMFDPQQVPSSGQAAPNESSVNPYTSDAGSGDAQTAPESVQPAYSNQPTQGNDSGSIPLGLRDLVKDYFSSLDQK